MSAIAGAPRVTASQEADHLLSAVESVVGSVVFQRTHRLCELLKYLHAQTIKGDAESLKEAVIGQRVFGRAANYNAADDTIVRSNIRQLRLKLDEYYRGEGAGDPWRVIVPKGSYGLKIEARPLLAAVDAGSHSAPYSETRRMSRLHWALIAGALSCIAVAIVAIAFRSQAASQHAHTLLALLTPSTGQRLLVIGADPNAQVYQSVTHRTVALHDYIDRRYLQPDSLRQVAPELLPFAGAIFRRSPADSLILNLIPRFAGIVPPSSLYLTATDKVTLKDFEINNAVLLSGPYGNPWVQLFDRSLNFQIEPHDNNTGTHIENRNPRASEPKSYYNVTESSTICYSRLAYLPGVQQGTRVILAGGPHVASTEAAGLFLTRPDSFDVVRRMLQKSPGGQLPWFEAVLEARALDNDPWSMRIVAIRPVHAPPAPSISQ